MSEKLLLTISILISNRPDTVEKCLKSLNSLRKKVPSELILVDTGCGEQVREMIEPYADEIIDFEWCNDFAKARNAGLKRAKGEWFMYLDDDEWFENTDEIEDFFVSGLYKEYNYAYYIVRNYMNLQGTSYSDGTVGRMIHLLPGVEFVHTIHEAFSFVQGPVIRFRSYAHHYGYAFATQEDKIRHFKRNIDLLESEHAKNPMVLRHNNQLAQEYNGLCEWEKSIAICDEGIKTGANSESNLHFLNGLFVNIVRCNLYLKNYEKAVEQGERYLGEAGLNDLARAGIYAYLTRAYFEMERYEDSIAAAEKYKVYYEKQKKDPDIYVIHENVLLSFCFQEEGVCGTFGTAVRAAIAMKDPICAKKYFDILEWNIQNPGLEYPIIDVIRECTKAWVKSDKEHNVDYEYFVTVFVKNTICLRIVLTCFEKWREIEPMLLRNQNINWGNFADKHWVFLYLKLWNHMEKEHDNLIREYQKLWKETENALLKSEELELWEMAEQDEISMEQVILSQPLFRWKSAVEVASKQLPFEVLMRLNERLHSFREQEHCNLCFWRMYYGKALVQWLTNQKEGIPDEKIIEEVLRFAEETVGMYQRLYKEEIFDMTPDLLPQECQAALKIITMKQAVENGKYAEALQAVKESLEIMPELSSVFKECTRWINKRYAEQSVELEYANHELKRLATSVKTQVINLIRFGKYNEAQNVLQQIKALIPDDEEIEQLESEIALKRRTFER